jgi:hypothetical protein
MTILCGVEQVNKTPLEPYAELVCDFLAEYSGALRKDAEAKQYPDVMTFAFWARKANVLQRKQEFQIHYANQVRLGKGIIFHIAPSNVPVNFMFSYAFGLLAGNANIVRVPSKPFPQVDCMCRVLEEVLAQKKYRKIHDMTSIIRYDRDKEVTDRLSGVCNMRIIWGGDDTIGDIRNSTLPPRSTEITFADRYSFGIVNTRKLLESSQEEKRQLAEDFYNDTYLMDQNACSTPHLICWTTDEVSEEEWNTAQAEFWSRINEVAKKYELADIKVSEKYSLLCEKAIGNDRISNVTRYDNLLYVCDVTELTEDAVTELRGKYGLFFQYQLKALEELSVLSGEKVQTCAYYGMDAERLAIFLKGNGYCGIDRIVPFGKTLEIDVVWDGYDLVAEMSRVIAVAKGKPV